MRWRGVTFDDKVTWCTVWGAVESINFFRPAILPLEKLPHRYTNVQKKDGKMNREAHFRSEKKWKQPKC